MRTIGSLYGLLACVWWTTLAGAANLPPTSSTPSEIHLNNDAGLAWRFPKTSSGWALGSPLLHGQRVEEPARQGLLFLRNVSSGEVRWLAGKEAQPVGARTARFAGETAVGDVRFAFELEVGLAEKAAAARLAPAWWVDKELEGWEVGLTYHDGFAADWRVQSYPYAGNSEAASISPMSYCGVPGALIYRPDLSCVVLFAIDSRFDYLNPTRWTGSTGFHFANRRLAPQFRMGGGRLVPGTRYEHPLELFFSDAGEFAPAITHLMQDWIQTAGYAVDASLHVRTPVEAFGIIVDGRRRSALWRPGMGYQHNDAAPFVYVGNNPYIAFSDYRLYEVTGEKVWRDRAFEAIEFAMKGQQTDPARPDCGVFHTTYNLSKRNDVEGFCSWDWSHNGYKVDLNVWMARYLLETWKRVKEREGVDRQDWYRAALASLEWVLRQQNDDGGLPQVVEIATGRKSPSVVGGRALVAMPIIEDLTGDRRFGELARGLERFLRTQVEGRFWYTGMHPDLPPGDYEQDSVYAAVEYWLNQHDRSGSRTALERAVANAYYGLLYWCPRQLSWVKAPTQGAHCEQQHYRQYSVYCYGNRKVQCLDRLFRKTGNPLFGALRDRVLQLNFYTQVAEGPYKGAMSEGIADPWLSLGGGYERRGFLYTCELVTDLMLQLLDLGLAGTP